MSNKLEGKLPTSASERITLNKNNLREKCRIIKNMTKARTFLITILQDTLSIFNTLHYLSGHNFKLLICLVKY